LSGNQENDGHPRKRKMLVQMRKYIQRLATALLLVCTGVQADNELEPAGLAVYTETARDIYVAGLLLPAGTGFENILLAPGPKAMEYRIAIRRISSRGFSGTLLLQAELGSGSRAPEQVISAVNKLKKNIKGALLKGDRFVITLSESDATGFYLNDIELLTIDDGSIFDFFFAGWVGESSSAMLQNNLLSGDLKPETLSRYESLAPGDERVATIAEWMAPPPPKPKPKPKPVKKPEPAPVQVAEATEVVAVAAGTVEAASTATAVAATSTTPAPATAAEAASTATAVAATSTTPAPATAAKPEPAPEPAAPEPAPASEIAVVVEEVTPEEPEIDDREYQRQLGEFVTHVMKSIFGRVVYPKRAVSREREGKVDLLVIMDERGKLLDVTVESSSGFQILDIAASKAVRKAAPFPELTRVAREEFLSEDGSNYVLPIPITFKLYN
jgi:protein TonB